MGERSKPSGSLGRERVVEAPPPATAVLFHPVFAVFAFSPTAEPGPRLRPYRKVHPTLHSPGENAKLELKLGILSSYRSLLSIQQNQKPITFSPALSLLGCMRLKCCWPDGEQANEGVNKMNIISVKLQGMDKKSKRKITTPCSLPSTPLLNMDGKWRVLASARLHP